MFTVLTARVFKQIKATPKIKATPGKKNADVYRFYRAGASGLGLKQATGTLPKQKALDLKQEISRKSRK